MELTPGPGQEDTSGDEVTGEEEADKEEARHQWHHVFHLGGFHSTLVSDFCAIHM